jgi:iron complex outermembrane receptor protein
MSRNWSILATGSFAVCNVFAGSAHAQASISEAATDGNATPEIIVTAQKRAQSIQKVPIAISAISSDDLERRQIQNITSLSSVAPNLQISRMPEADANPQVSIRGSVSINPDQLQVGQPVGLYVDGVYVGGGAGSLFDLVDLERIEILRGPQGTLYGRNTLAGAVNLIARRPSGELSGSASLDVGNLDLRTLRLKADLPKAGIVSLSGAYRRERRDGWMTIDVRDPSAPPNAPGGSSQLGYRHSDAARIAALFDFAPNFNALYTFDISKSKLATPSQLYRTNPLFWSSIGLGVFNDRASTDRQRAGLSNFSNVTSTNVMGHALTATWNLGGVDLKSITSFRKVKQRAGGIDLDKSELDIVHEPPHELTYRQWSQELQAVGQLGPLNYVFGLYYFGDKGFRHLDLSFFFDTGRTTETTHTSVDSYAAYGQVEYAVTDRLKLTAGYRYNKEKQRTESLINSSPVDGVTKSSKGTPLFIASYDLAHDVNVYAKYSQGFKAGYTWQTNILVGLPGQIKPETQTTYEAGLRSQFLNRAVTLNVTTFLNKKRDLQLTVFAPTTGGGVATGFRNAGKATQWGIEVEGAVRPMDWLTLQANYGYLHSKYDTFIDNQIDVADNRAFIHAPKHTLSFSMDALLMKREWGKLRYNMSYNYSSSFYTYAYQLAGSGPAFDPTQAVAGNSRVGAAGFINARLALSDIRVGDGARPNAEVALWVNNLTNKDQVENFIDFGPSFGGLETAFFNDPRTYGVTLGFKF